MASPKPRDAATGWASNTGGRHNDLDELRDALAGRGVELVSYLLGFEPNRRLSNRTETRWGRKGSFALMTAGRYRGRWSDHESGERGGLLDLIVRHEARDFPHAVRWAREWLGWASDAPRPAPRKADELRREREARKAREAAEQAAEDARKAAYAGRLWNEARPIAGTLGERYLVDTRAIPSPSWPDAIRWHDGERAIVCRVTDDAGEIVAVQLIRIGPDARKDETREPVKQSFGSVGKGLVRLAGRADGPVCYAEGPETGLSIWAATGYETHIALGGMKRAAELARDGRRLVICRDDDGRASPAYRAARAMVAELRENGEDVREAFPFERRRANGDDFNTLAQEAGLEAVRERIEAAASDGPGIHKRLVTVDAARVTMGKRTREFFDKARAWQEGETPPVDAMGVTVGTGKTEAALQEARRMLLDLRARGDNRAIVFAVPEHKLSDEIKRRFTKIAGDDGLKAQVWRGRAARPEDGDEGEHMCADYETVREAQRLCADVDDEICKPCRWRDGCDYLAQKSRDGDLWIVAHNLIVDNKRPKAIARRGIAALVVDESPLQAGLIGIEGRGVSIPPDALATLPTPQGLDGHNLASKRETLVQALANEPEGYVRRAALAAKGFSEESAKEAARLEWMRKVTDGPWREREANRTLNTMGAIWRAVAKTMADEGCDVTGLLRLERDKEGVRRLRVYGRQEIGEAWRVPTLLIDALLNVDLVRHYWPNVREVGRFDVDAPWQTVRQFASKSYAKSWLAPPAKEGEPDKNAKARRKLRAFILREARRVGGKALVVGNKRVVEAMNLQAAGVEVAWFNAVAGRDNWGDARLIIVVGRPGVTPSQVERMAGALSGRAPATVTDWHSRADASRMLRLPGGRIELVDAETDRHPDPLAETIRARIDGGEIVQAIGRGRGVKRGPDKPLEVIVLGDAALPVPIDEIAPNDGADVSTVDLMLSEGGIAFEDGASASRAYPHLWRSPGAARMAFARDNKAASHSPWDITYGKRDGAFETALFQREGNGQTMQRALVDRRRVPDPEAALAAMVGPLARFELIAPLRPVDPPAPRRELAPPPLTPEFCASIKGEPVEIAAPGDFETDTRARARDGEAPPEDGNAIVCGNDANESVYIDWGFVRQRAADCGLKLGDVAAGVGISPGQFRNIQTGFRRATPELAQRILAFVEAAPVTQPGLGL